MKILHISDSHTKHQQIDLKPYAEADVIVFSGDLSYRGRESEVKEFMEWFGRLPFQYKIFIAGNHDISFDVDLQKDKQKPEWLREELEKFQQYESSNFYLENTECIIEGIKFWGSPVTPSFHRENGWAFNKDRGSEINEVWKQIPFDLDVLITHGPPFGQCDYAEYSNEYVGCFDLIQYIKRIQPKLHLFGHLHESRGISYNEYTYFSNACVCNLRYEVINLPILWEINKESDPQTTLLLK